MKRLHVHLRVSDLNASIVFYNTLFAQEPSVVKSDYAKWQLEDPHVNFAISNRSPVTGIDHLGVQTDSLTQWLAENATDQTAEAGEATTCCYAKSHKRWVTDPDGISWEQFTSIGESDHYGVDSHSLTQDNAHTEVNGFRENGAGLDEEANTGCCSPRPKSGMACC